MSNIVVFTTESTSGLKSTIDLRFGRADAFVLVDVVTGAVVNEVDNTGQTAEHGAGIAAASLVASQKVTAVVSGRIGPKAYEALDKLGIEMWLIEESCSVSEALKRYREGRLTSQKTRVFS